MFEIHEYLSKRELAELLNVDVATLNAMLQDGAGPKATRLGRRDVFTRNAVAQWLESSGLGTYHEDEDRESA